MAASIGERAVERDIIRRAQEAVTVFEELLAEVVGLRARVQQLEERAGLAAPASPRPPCPLCGDALCACERCESCDEPMAPGTYHMDEDGVAWHRDGLGCRRDAVGGGR